MGLVCSGPTAKKGTIVLVCFIGELRSYTHMKAFNSYLLSTRLGKCLLDVMRGRERLSVK